MRKECQQNDSIKFKQSLTSTCHDHYNSLTLSFLPSLNAKLTHLKLSLYTRKPRPFYWDTCFVWNWISQLKNSLTLLWTYLFFPESPSRKKRKKPMCYVELLFALKGEWKESNIMWYVIFNIEKKYLYSLYLDIPYLYRWNCNLVYWLYTTCLWK